MGVEAGDAQRLRAGAGAPVAATARGPQGDGAQRGDYPPPLTLERGAMSPPPPLLSRGTHGVAVFLDFDGTLSPIVDVPERAWLSGAALAAILRLERQLDGALAIVSGRAAGDLALRVPTVLWRVGSHGAEPLPPHQWPAAVRDYLSRHGDAAQVLAALARQWPGVRIEPKPHGVAIHYRHRPEAEQACQRTAQDLASADPGLTVQLGKMVAELRPRTADKGRALATLMQQAPFTGRRPVMVGDDLTDEPAIVRAQELGGFGVRVGAGPTEAMHRLADPGQVIAWLQAAPVDD